MNINTLLLMIDIKKNEINKLNKNNITNNVKIDELTIEKQNLTSELLITEEEFGKENKKYKNNFIKLGQTRTLIDNLNKNIRSPFSTLCFRCNKDIQTSKIHVNADGSIICDDCSKTKASWLGL